MASPPADHPREHYWKGKPPVEDYNYLLVQVRKKRLKVLDSSLSPILRKALRNRRGLSQRHSHPIETHSKHLSSTPVSASNMILS
jgi:hypothetical protein